MHTNAIEGFTEEVEDIINRANPADSFQGPSPHPTFAPVDEDSEHKRNNSESSASWAAEQPQGGIDSKAQKPISPSETVSGKPENSLHGN